MRNFTKPSIDEDFYTESVRWKILSAENNPLPEEQLRARIRIAEGQARLQNKLLEIVWGKSVPETSLELDALSQKINDLNFPSDRKKNILESVSVPYCYSDNTR